MPIPRPRRDLLEQSALLIERARRAVSASRVLLGASAVLVAPVRRPTPVIPRAKGFADLTAWIARKR
jgi:hypothetical protein